MNIVPFSFENTPAQLPAAIVKRKAQAGNEIVGNSAGEGFPVVSIKGKVFHVTRGDEKTLITRPGEDAPASAIEVVLVKANPNRSKVFYATGYVEGTQAKPTCFSNDGIAPDKDAQERQSTKCATCQHNQWGSRITDGGKKAKACQDSRRLAIAMPGAPADAMLLRVPAASMKNLEDYGKMLAARGLEPYTVITKIGFDYTVAFPALTFKPAGLIADETHLEEIERARVTETVNKIVGVAPMTPAENTEDAVNDEEVVSAPPPAPVAAAPAPAPAPVKAAAKPAPAPAPSPAVAITEDVKTMLADLDFDD